MSSAADPADAPSGTSATEFVLEEFETTVPETAIDDLAECITEIVQDLRAAVVDDEQLESLLRGDPGPDVLHGADLTEQGDPEPFTQRTIIEPLFNALGYPEFTTEASGLWTDVTNSRKQVYSQALRMNTTFAIYSQSGS